MPVSPKAGSRPSEYGGVDGIIQPESKGHVSRAENNADRRAVQEEAMIVRGALRKEAHGLLVSKTEVRNDDGSITVTDVHFTEEDVRTEYGGNR